MHGALVAVALSSSVLAYNYVAKASPEVTPGSSTLAQRVGQALAGQEFAFADLEVLTRTMDYVSEKYVEPERLDPPAMFDAGLEAVEKMVP